MENLYHPKLHQLMKRIGIIVAAAAFIAGCATTPAPTEQMAISRAAINNANSAGANEFAPLQIKAAMEKMDAAERAMLQKEYVHARQLAEQAQVDAQLAGATAYSVKAQKMADALQEDRRILREEIDRKTE